MAFPDAESFCRIFILGAKALDDDELRAEAGKYGTVKDLYVVKDRTTHERKDVAYVTFSKASEAALAIEEMNGKCPEGVRRPLKVILANNRNEGNVREVNEEQKMLRLFIMVPDGYTEEQIQEDFAKYGAIEHIRFVKDRKTGKANSLAYVKYNSPYHAALALEQVDPRYRPKFATAPSNPNSGNSSRAPAPRDDDRRRSDPYRRGNDRPVSSDRYRRYPSPHDSPPTFRAPPRNPVSHSVETLELLLSGYPSNCPFVLEACMPTASTEEQVYKLFDIVPGLVDFKYNSSTGHVLLKYSLPQLAAYARNKIDGLEYPPGCRVAVDFYKKPGSSYDSFDPRSDVGSRIGSSIYDMNRGMMMAAQNPNGPGAVKSLVDTVQKAMIILQQTGLAPSATADLAWGLGDSAGGDYKGYGSTGGGYFSGETSQARYCNVPLPERQPLAPKDSEIAERLFIVAVPEAFPSSFLEDCFCRFGNLIDAFFMPGRNCGYVKFASSESARRAVNTLHMKTVCGNTLKVMVADEPPTSGKRRFNEGNRSMSPSDMKHSRMS